jgi:FixJ family two-component response regulator
MTSADSPIVFIVDDDSRMRAAMRRLLKTVGLHSKSFATVVEPACSNPRTSDYVAGRTRDSKDPS